MEMGGGLSKLDPATGELHTWRLPDPTRPFIHEILPTADGSVWLTIEKQNALARFDTRTEKFDVYRQPYDGPPPVEMEPNAPWPTLRYTAGDQTSDPRRHTAVADLQGNIGVRAARSASSISRPKNSPSSPKFQTSTASPWIGRKCLVCRVQFQGSSQHRQSGSENQQDHKMDAAKFRRASAPPEDRFARDDLARGLLRRKPDAVGSEDANVQGIQAAWTNADALRYHRRPQRQPLVCVHVHRCNWKLNPKTGKVIEYPTPYGERGTRDMFEDEQGRIWYGAQPYGKVGYVRLRED